MDPSDSTLAAKRRPLWVVFLLAILKRSDSVLVPRGIAVRVVVMVGEVIRGSTGLHVQEIASPTNASTNVASGYIERLLAFMAPQFFAFKHADDVNLPILSHAPSTSPSGLSSVR